MANYSFFLGQGGGGGGTGDFAIIKIEYPEGSEIQVTFDGDTIDAPDTSGVWIYGCDEAGTYTISIKNTTISKTVAITTKGQSEYVYISPQIINYALIYYLGNEFAEPSEDEKAYAIKTGGWNVDTYIGSDKLIASALDIQTPNSCKQFWFTKAGVNGDKRVYYSIGLKNINRYLSNSSNGNAFGLGSESITENTYAQISRDRNLGTYMTIGKANNCIACGFAGGDDYFYVYALGFVKTDSLSGLSAYGTTISAIISKATSIFNDVTALSWMALNCTGDFMISALNDSGFVTAMNASANKSILVANEHWNRFIALLSL